MTDNQLQSNRANAQLSTGPRTEPGKRRSSFNGFKHGLCSKVHIATPQETEAFQAHCAAYREELAPVGVIESDLVQLIAEDRWRLKRAHAIENSIFAGGIHLHSAEHDTGRPEVDDALAEGQTWVDQSRFLATLTIYEQRIQRSLRENAAALNAHQIARKQAHHQAQKDAVLLAAIAEKQGEVYNPAPDFPNPADHGGFAYDAAETRRLVDRDRRLREAVYLNQPLPRLPAILPRAA
jgi:hypothetical protein